MTLLGTWRDCPAVQIAYDNGSIVLEESDLCENVGCQPEQLEAYIHENWREHDIDAVLRGPDEVSRNTYHSCDNTKATSFCGSFPRSSPTLTSSAGCALTAAPAGRTWERYVLRSLYVMLDYHITADNGEMGRVPFLFDNVLPGPYTRPTLRRPPRYGQRTHPPRSLRTRMVFRRLQAR